MKLLLTILITYIIVSFFGYFAHKALHQKWSGKYNKSHMTHHIKLYPANNYTSETYRDSGKDDAIWFFIVISIPVILLPILLGIIGLPIYLVITSILEMLILAFLNNYIHYAYHINNHWLTKIPLLNKIFNKFKHLHFIHHKNMQKNLGIFDFTWDFLLKTLKK